MRKKEHMQQHDVLGQKWERVEKQEVKLQRGAETVHLEFSAPP